MPTNYTNLHEKRIGSWFSLASPIKTTAGFSIKRRMGMKMGSFAHELREFARKGIKALLLFRHLAIQLSSLAFGLKRGGGDFEFWIMNCGLKIED
ncbi:hypothetical protein [Chlorobium phaeobacteroides]|uniref:hypothetical protein n=1 Tax=Chlorobium phaeobacteroides TaxID=1096 RepID=UPI00059B8FAC|nr:hypothetical protein [Chlorobium phaeobacteroides]